VGFLGRFPPRAPEKKFLGGALGECTRIIFGGRCEPTGKRESWEDGENLRGKKFLMCGWWKFWGPLC